MPLLNYTSSVPVSRTIPEMHAILLKCRARSISTDYDEGGLPLALSFLVETPLGWRHFRLPINALAVEQVMHKDSAVSPKLKTAAQAQRVAWRIAKDWLAAQLAIIETEMVTLDQVMLPYMKGDDGQTVYELYVNKQLVLPAGDA